MASRLKRTAAALAVSAIEASWTQVGQTIAQPMILGVAIDYNETTASPVIAYGYSNSSDGGATTISFDALSVAKTWMPSASHTPEFGQTYDDFTFRVRDDTLYLGLRITEEGDDSLSSVLRGRGGWDGFEGCYAFYGWVYDWDLAPSTNGTHFSAGPSGDMRLVVSPDNATVATAGYAAAGWDQYPAADTWSAYVNVSTGSTGPVHELVTCTGCDGGLFAGWVQDGTAGVAWTRADPASNKVWNPIAGASFPGAVGLGLAYSPWRVAPARCSDGGALCASWYTPSGAINVSCESTGQAKGFTSGSMMAALQGVRGDMELYSGIALSPLPGHSTPTTTGTGTGAAPSLVLAVAGISAGNAAQLLTAYCTLGQDSSGNVSCQSAWVTSAITAPGGAPINDFQLKASPHWSSSAPSVHAIVSSGPCDGSGDAISVWELFASR